MENPVAPSLRDDDPWWLKKAFQEIGTKEVKGPKKNNPKIVEYHKWTTLGAENDEVPWCAAFVRWIFKRLGPANARSFMVFGKPVPFQRGAIVVFSRDEAGPLAGHVGFALEQYFDAAKNRHMILCLGGNQKDSVCIQEINRSRVLGYRWPPSELLNNPKGE